MHATSIAEISIKLIRFSNTSLTFNLVKVNAAQLAALAYIILSYTFLNVSMTYSASSSVMVEFCALAVSVTAIRRASIHRLAAGMSDIRCFIFSFTFGLGWFVLEKSVRISSR